MNDLIEVFDAYMSDAINELSAIASHFEDAKEAILKGQIEWAEEVLVDAVSEHMMGLQRAVGKLEYCALDGLIEEVDAALEEKYGNK
jgi:hypothetical protein